MTAVIELLDDGKNNHQVDEQTDDEADEIISIDFLFHALTLRLKNNSVQNIFGGGAGQGGGFRAAKRTEVGRAAPPAGSSEVRRGW